MVSFILRRAGELALMLAMGWLLSRQDLGVFNAWKAVLPPLAVVVAGGWDTVLLRRRRNAAIHAELMVVWTVGASVAVALALLLGGGLVARWYHEPDLEWFFRLAGIPLMAQGVVRALRAVLAQRLDQAAVARWEIVRLALFGIGASAMMLSVDTPQVSDLEVLVGLIVAWAAADIAEAIGLALIGPGGGYLLALWRQARGTRLGYLRRRAAWRREWRFAAMLTADQLLNALSVGLPVYLLGRSLGPESVAFFSYGMQFVALPLYAILEAVNRIALPGLLGGEAMRDRQAARALELVRHLALLAMPLLLWAFAAAPRFFGLVLGEDWVPAGELTRCFVIFLVMAPMTTISGPVEAITGRPGVGLTWNVMTLLGRAVVLWFGLKWGGLMPAMLAYGSFSLGMWLFYQYLIASLLELPLAQVVLNWARFIPVWGALLTFWMLWPSHEGDRPESLAVLLVGGAAGLMVYSILLALFHRKHLAALLRLVGALRR